MSTKVLGWLMTIWIFGGLPLVLLWAVVADAMGWEHEDPTGFPRDEHCMTDYPYKCFDPER